MVTLKHVDPIGWNKVTSTCLTYYWMESGFSPHKMEKITAHCHPMGLRMKFPSSLMDEKSNRPVDGIP
jgi:hypothetical protein